MQVGYNQKGTYKARVSYALTYQVCNNSWSSFNTILTHSHCRARFRSWDRYTTISTPSPYHNHTIAQSTGQLPLDTVSRPVAPGYDRTLTPWGKKRRTHLISSLSETQERSIADKSTHVSIDQPYTLQRFYITTRSAFLADRRQLG